MFSFNVCNLCSTNLQLPLPQRDLNLKYNYYAQLSDKQFDESFLNIQKTEIHSDESLGSALSVSEEEIHYIQRKFFVDTNVLDHSPTHRSQNMFGLSFCPPSRPPWYAFWS